VTELGIVIVSYNARGDLERCLESLAAQAPRIAHEIVVVDNGSSDGTVEAIRARWPAMRLIEAGANLGFARATNMGIRAVAGEFILLLNGDTIVPAGAIDGLVAVLRNRPEITVVGPRLVGPDGVPELSFGGMITPWQELRRKVLGRLHARRVGLASWRVARLTAREREVDWVSGACLLVRRRAAEAAGLLDERYFLYNEDVDFCAAIRQGGGRVLFTPAVQIVHVRGRSAATAPRAVSMAYRRSQLAFYRKHLPRWLPILRAYLRLTGKSRGLDGGPGPVC
jgi:N-acetylglucosaminyl-diphospho-decaprenol L-rhamnosyltransferase